MLCQLVSDRGRGRRSVREPVALSVRPRGLGVVTDAGEGCREATLAFPVLGFAGSYVDLPRPFGRHRPVAVELAGCSCRKRNRSELLLWSPRSLA